MTYRQGDGQPIDITSYSIDIEIESGKGEVIEDLSIGSGITITDSAGGIFTVFVADTSLWPVGRLKSDILITRPDNKVVASETFYINVIEGVTNA